MHNLTKIKVFRCLLWCTFPFALIFIYPLVLFKKKKKTHLFFLFDRYSIGGAQRIHLDILNSLADVEKQLYFTRLSINKGLKEVFYNVPNTPVEDIHYWCDNLVFRLFSIHYFAFYINRHPKAHVLGANSTYFYDLLPFLKRSVVKTELLHNFMHSKGGMEWFGLGNVQYLDYRIVYDAYTLSNIKNQYAEYKIAPEYLDRILFIEPGVDIPEKVEKNFTPPMRVLYAGRGGYQKRIPLLNAIAEHCIDQRWPVQFHFAGTMDAELSDKVKQASVLHGEISAQAAMQQLYGQSHVVLMTSAFEGFPMLIKESMACGCVPVVTALEGNKMHLHTRQNALLIDAVADEDAVIVQGIERIRELLEEPGLLPGLSEAAYMYATQHFTKEKFEQAYRQLLLGA